MDPGSKDHSNFKSSLKKPSDYRQRTHIIQNSFCSGVGGGIRRLLKNFNFFFLILSFAKLNETNGGVKKSAYSLIFQKGGYPLP